MRRIEITSAFKPDYKRELKGTHKNILPRIFQELITTLAGDAVLSAKHRDHLLTGDWKDHT